MFTVFRKAALLAHARAARKDPYYDHVVALVRADGDSIVDEKGTPITIEGNPVILRDGSARAGGGCIQVAATDKLTLPARPEFQVDGDFTVEFWIYPMAYPAAGTNSHFAWRGRPSAYSSHGAWLKPDGKIQTHFGNAANGYTVGIVDVTINQVIPLNKWIHVVQQRRGSSCEIYFDGVLKLQAQGDQRDENTNLGVTLVSGFTGLIDEIRITRDFARYTGDGFTPSRDSYPSESSNIDNHYEWVQLLLRANGSPGWDNFGDMKGHAITIASGNPYFMNNALFPGKSAVYFDGVDDAIRVAATTDFDFGTGDFTVEATFLTEALTSGSYHVIITHGFPTNARGMMVTLNGTNKRLEAWETQAGATSWSGNAPIVVTPDNSIALNTVYRIAYVRKGDKRMLFINGVMAGVATGVTAVTSLNNANGSLTIGRAASNVSQFFKGYIDEVRVTKGVARYTTGHRALPVTQEHPITSGPSTKVMLNCDALPLVDLSPNPKTFMGTILTTDVGRYAGGRALKLNGVNNEYLKTRHRDFSLGNRDFTLEFWIKAAAQTAANAHILSLENENGLQLDSTQYFGGLVVTASGVYVSLNGTAWWTAAKPLGGIFDNEWHHIAIIRAGAALTVYNNGSQQGTVANIGTNSIAPCPGGIGANANGIQNPGSLLIGKMGTLTTAPKNQACLLDQIRFSNKAIWTGDFFFPPSAPYSGNE